MIFFIISDEIHGDLVDEGAYHRSITLLGLELAERSITLMLDRETYDIAGLNATFAIIPMHRCDKPFCSAGGSVAAQRVARLRPDGYTNLLGPNGPLTINPTVQSNLGYDPIGDYAPIGLVVRSPMVIAVHRSTPTTTEAGVAGFQAAVFVGIVVPTGLPDDVAKSLGEAVSAAAAVADAGVRRQMEGWEA